MCAWGMPAAAIDDAGHTAGAATGNKPWERRAATRTVAANSKSAEEAAVMLAMLGLRAVDGKAEAA